MLAGGSGEANLALVVMSSLSRLDLFGYAIYAGFLITARRAACLAGDPLCSYLLLAISALLLYYLPNV